MTAKALTTDEILIKIFRDLNNREPQNVSRKVAIISTPRCGSSMFCNVLAKTTQLGDPKEWFNMRYLNAYAQVFQRKQVQLQEYLAFVASRSASANGIWSVNFHVEQYLHMRRNGFDVCSMDFERIYFLYRNDKIGQAYSLALASVTDQWRSEAAALRKAPDRLGREKILKSLLHISNSEEYYTDNLSDRVDREFAYEDFSCLHETSAFAAVYDDLDLEVPPTALATDYQKQAPEREPEELKALRQYLRVTAN